MAEVEIYAAPHPARPRDLVLLQGAEPSMRWRSFCKLIVDLAEALGTQMVVTMGALLADVRTRAPCRSPACPPTRASSSASG
jgi:proteasome assembly chaperone (PAC2) family protein